MNTKKKINWSEYLEPEESLETVSLATLRQRRSRAQKEMREKVDAEKRALEAEKQEQIELYKSLSLYFFGEQTPGVDAETFEAEVQIHREFARALGQPDVQLGETLRNFAKRVWEGWVNQPTSWICVDGVRSRPYPTDGWCLAFNRREQRFDGFHGFSVEYWQEPFEKLWSPSGCTGDEVIDVDSLPPLPYRKMRPKS